MKGLLTVLVSSILMLWISCLITGSGSDADFATAVRRLHDTAAGRAQLLQRLLGTDRNYAGREKNTDGIDDQELRRSAKRWCWFCSGHTASKKEGKNKENKNKIKKHSDWWRKFG